MALSAQQLTIAQYVQTPIVQDNNPQSNVVVVPFGTNIVVLARAGTGKTWLLRQCIPFMQGEIAVMAYNTKIKNEILGKLRDDGHLRSYRNMMLGTAGADVWTFHAFGWNTIRKMLPGIRLEGKDDGQAGFYKFTVIAERLNIPKPLQSCVRKAMERAMERGFGIKGMIAMNDADAWMDLANHYALAEELPEDGSVLAQMLGLDDGKFEAEDVELLLLKRCLRYAAQAIVMSMKMVTETFTRETIVRGKTVKGETFKGVISFGEQIYLPLKWDMPLPQYDWVLVDEAQDSNPIRREMAKRMRKASCRMIWVGDDRQAINGWTGADNNALEQIIEQLNCKVFPMTVTFRCSKAVVRRAQRLVPDYQAAENNPEGEEYSISEEEFAKIELISDRGDNGTPDAVICRNTAPLVKIAYKLFARGVRCHVEGRDIGKGLIKLLSQFKAKTLPTLITRLGDYKEKEVAKLMNNGQEMAADSLVDKIESLLAIIESLPKGATVDSLTVQVDTLFADTDGKGTGSIPLMTAHRSKGLEFTRVFAWGMEKFIPSKYAKQEWQLAQEENLEYVTITRAIDTLVSVRVA